MIYIKETFSRDDSVIIQVDGILDGESINVLREVCHRHLGSKKHVYLNLQGLIHILREGREFLREMQGEIQIHPPDLVCLETKPK